MCPLALTCTSVREWGGLGGPVGTFTALWLIDPESRKGSLPHCFPLTPHGGRTVHTLTHTRQKGPGECPVKDMLSARKTATAEGLHWPHHRLHSGPLSSPLTQNPQTSTAPLCHLLICGRSGQIWGSFNIPRFSLIRTFPPIADWAQGHVALCLSGRE